MQSDFLLIANREDIDPSSEWNIGLRKAIPFAFLEAARKLNQDQKLRYTWIRLLPVRTRIEDFFENLATDIIRLLADEPVVESYSGVLRVPRDLIYVPKWCCDKTGVPLTLTEKTKLHYVSKHYAAIDWPVLRQLGVVELTPENFLLDLKDLVNDNPEQFKEKPSKWHSTLAQMVSNIITREAWLRSHVASLKIIPLRNGQWVSPTYGCLFFPHESRPLHAPEEVGVFELDFDACKDNNRKQLFIQLGVQIFQDLAICNAVVAKHADLRFKPDLLSIDCLFSHVEFLYNAGWVNPGSCDLWLSAEDGSPRKGSRLYLESTDQHTATSLFAVNRDRVKFLHKDYYRLSNGNMEEKRWQEWLLANLHVAVVPRLIEPSVGLPFQLSEDFMFIFKRYGSATSLLLLRDNWEYYSRWLEGGSFRDVGQEWRVSRMAVTFTLRALEVQCLGGISTPLQGTFLPKIQLPPELSISVPLLSIPDADNPRWVVLKHLGVITEMGVDIFIHCLHQLKRTDVGIEIVSQLYHEICRRTREDPELVRYCTDKSAA